VKPRTTKITSRRGRSAEIIPIRTQTETVHVKELWRELSVKNAATEGIESQPKSPESSTEIVAVIGTETRRGSLDGREVALLVSVRREAEETIVATEIK